MLFKLMCEGSPINYCSKITEECNNAAMLQCAWKGFPSHLSRSPYTPWLWSLRITVQHEKICS